MTKHSKWASLVLCIAASACNGTGASGEAATQQVSQAIWNGTADNGPTSDPWRNAVVALGGGCTGFYVTSTLIVTANHCVNGDDSGPGVIKVGSTVFIGRDSQNWDDTRTIRSINTITKAKTGDANADFDIALAEAWPPVVDTVYAQKPRFITPPLSDGVGHFPLLLAGWGLDQTLSTPRFRQLQFFDDPKIHRVNDLDHGWYMTFGDPYTGTDSGDSGGPLLWRYDPNDPRKWDLIGATHGGNVPASGNLGDACTNVLGINFCDTIYADWVDLTWTSPSADPLKEGIGRWLQRVATDFAPDFWEARWRGETDYVGPCRKDVDPDCDRFISKVFGGSDSCPALYNPEQQTAAGDTDNDGVLDWCDNCPADANPKQENADGDSFGDACDSCPGSQESDSGCSGGCAGPGNRCVSYQDPAKADCYDPLLNNVDCNVTSRCAKPNDTDSDNVADQCDNCLKVKNLSQANCNEDAERSRNVPLLGDACDPVPCSRSTTQQVRLDASFAGSACLLPGSSCPVVVSADISWQGVNNSVSQISGTTEFAHCNCDRAHDSATDRLLNCSTDVFGHALCPFGRANAFPAASGTLSPSAWHAITTTAPRGMSVPNPGALQRIDLSKIASQLTISRAPVSGAVNADHPTLYSQSSPTGRTRWMFDRDINRFGLSFTPPAGGITSASALLPLANAFQGVGWAFTNSYSGPAASADLRNNYFPQDLDPQNNYLIKIPNAPIAVLPPWIRPQPGVCAGCSSERFPWVSRVNDPLLDPRAVIGIGVDTTQVIIPNFDAGLLELLGRVGAGVSLHAPSESDTIIDRLSATERGVLLSADTRRITAIHAAAGGALVSQLLPITLTSLPDAAAFSAVRGELYTLRQTESGEELDIIDTRSSQLVQRMLTNVGKGVPLSATYRYSDDAIYVVDRVSSGALRLLRVDRAGKARDLGQIPDVGLRTAFHLASTYDDRLLLSATGQAWDQPLYLELTTTDTAAQVVSTRYGARPGAFLAPPRANRATGFAVALGSGFAGVQNFGEERRADFAASPATPLANASSLFRARSALDNCPSQSITSASNCAPLRSIAVYAARQLKIDDHASIRTSSGGYALSASGGSLTTTIGPDAQVGTILSVAPVDLRDRVSVTGFVKSSGAVTPGNGLTLSGPIIPQASLLPVPLTGFAAQFPATVVNTVPLEPGQTSTIVPGSYGDELIKQGATLRLSSGVYSFHSLDVESGGTLSLNTSAGPIFVYVETTLTYRGATVTERGANSDLLLAVFGTGLVSIESSFTGTLVAPNASIVLAFVTAGHSGSFFGLDVEVSPRTKVTLVPFNYPWTP